MKKYSIETIEFIKKYVLGKMNLKEINDENIASIVDYIVDNYEVPLAQAKEAGDQFDNALLEAATNAVTEITTDPDW